MGNPSRSMKDRGAEGDLKSGGLAQHVSDKENIFMWPKDCSFDILANNLAASCKNKSKEKFQGVVVHDFNSSTLEADAYISESSSKGSLIYRASSKIATVRQ